MIIRLDDLPLEDLEPLLLESEVEGFCFVRRLRDDWVSGVNRFDGPGEAFFGYYAGGHLVAVGGLNRQSATRGRLRRIYVAQRARRTGVGRALVGHIVRYASEFFDELVLHTETVAGDAFYGALGFSRSCDPGDPSHIIKIQKLDLSDTPSLETQQERWNRIFEEFGTKRPVYDDWLEKYGEILAASRVTPIIDLGCGSENNTLYLYEQGYQVISCDFAVAALQRLSHFIPSPVTRLFDLRSRFPFEDGAAKIVVADLCLHYFSKAQTIGIIAEIRRVLGGGGWLFSRVNSVKDVYHGAGEGAAIEPSYYAHEGDRKRFFDELSLRAFFAKWKIKALHEYEMSRYEKPKIVWELAAQK